MHRRRTRTVAALAASVLVLLGAVAWWSGEVPRWTLGGARMTGPEPIPAQLPFALVVPDGGQVLFVGDSNTAGTQVGGPEQAFPAQFAGRLDGRFPVVVRAFGGATVADHLARGLPQGGFALTFVMLGTNDAATRGVLAARKPVPVAAYRSDLAQLAERLQAGGARVVILAPPPVGTSAMARRLQPYRLAAAEVARATRSGFLDPAEAFAEADQTGLLQYDALHLGPEAQRLLGLWLAAQIDQTSRASSTGSSSTGNPSPPSASQPS